MAPPKSNRRGNDLDLNRYEFLAFSTLGFLHDRGLSNRLFKTLTLSSDCADGSSRTATTEQNIPVYMTGIASRNGGPSLVSRSSPI